MAVGSLLGCVETLGAPGDKKVYYLRMSRRTNWPILPAYAGTNYTVFPAILQTLDVNGFLNALDPATRTVGWTGVRLQNYGTYNPPTNNRLEITSNDQSYWGNAPGLTEWQATSWNTAAQANFASLRSDNTVPAFTPPQWVMWRILDNWGNPGATVGEVRLMLRTNLTWQRAGITMELLDENYHPVWVHTIGQPPVVAGPVVDWIQGTGVPNRIRLTPK